MRKGFSLILLFCIIILTVVAGLAIFKFTRSPSGQITISDNMTEEFSQKYLEVWNKFFLKANRNISESYFKAHIFPQSTRLNKLNPLGEEFIVNYNFKVDWVTMPFQDSIIIKPNDEDHYLSLEELYLKAGWNSNTSYGPSVALYYLTIFIIPVEKVITEEEAKIKLRTCDSEMTPHVKPFDIREFRFTKEFLVEERSEQNKKRLLYIGARKMPNSNWKMAEVDLETGKTNCSPEVTLPF